MHDLDLGEFHGIDLSVNPDVCVLLSNLVKIQLKKSNFSMNGRRARRLRTVIKEKQTQS